MAKNQRGSALAWTMAILLGLSIFVIASMTISLSYMRRAVAQNMEKQAYLTAKSGAQTIAFEITQETEAGKGILEQLKPVDPGQKTTEVTFDVPFQEGMGSCQVTVKRDVEKNTMTVAATGKKQDAQKTVVANLNRVRKDYSYRQVFYGGLVLDSMNYNPILNTIGDTDVFVRGQATIRGTEDNPIRLSRNLAVQGIITSLSNNIHVHGLVVARNAVAINEGVTIGVNPDDPDSDPCGKPAATFSGVYTPGVVSISGATIYGDVTGREIRLSEGAKVVGNLISTQPPEIEEGCQVTGETIQVEKIDDLIPDGYLESQPEEVLIPDRVPPSMPEKPAGATVIDKDSIQQGADRKSYLELGKDGQQYYVVKKEADTEAVGAFNLIIQNTSDHPVYVFVEPDAALTFREVGGTNVKLEDGSKRTVPNIYFILEGSKDRRAELRINTLQEKEPQQTVDTAPKVYLYAFGNGKILTNSNEDETKAKNMMKLYGGLYTVLNLTDYLGFPEVEYIPIDLETGLPVVDDPEDVKGEITRWELQSYQRGDTQ